MTPETTPPTGDRPTSWRDVYTLVQDVEKRLADRLDDAVASTRQVATDHEYRIRSVEVAGAPVAQNAHQLAQSNALRISALEAANVVRAARRYGVMAVGSTTKAVLLITIGLIGPAVTTIFLRIILPQ